MLARSNRRQRGRLPRSRPVNQQTRDIPRPPQLQTSLVVGRTLRFKTNASGTSQITWNFIGALLSMAATATSAYSIASYVKVRKVEMWGPAGTEMSLEVNTLDGTSEGPSGPSDYRSDYALGNSVAYISWQPKVNTAAFFWHNAEDNSAAFKLTYASGTVIDLHYTFTVADNGSAVATVGAVSGATAGVVYVRNLDAAGGKIPPVDLATI